MKRDVYTKEIDDLIITMSDLVWTGDLMFSENFVYRLF